MKNMTSSFLLLIILLIPVPGLSYFSDKCNSLFSQGIINYREENFEEAVITLKQAYNACPSTKIAFYLGLCYKQMGEYEKSEKFFKMAISSKPIIYDAYVELIQILYEVNRLDEAEKFLNKAEKEGIYPSKILFLKGLIYKKMGQFKKAISAFEKAGHLDPSTKESSDLQIAIIYANMRSYSKAKEILKGIVKSAPETDMSKFAKEYLKSLDRLTKEYKPWAIDLRFGGVYDTNVVSKPSDNIGLAAVDEISRKKDGGVYGSFNFSYTPILPIPYYLNIDYNMSEKRYFHKIEYNLSSQEITLTPGITFKKWALTLPSGLTYIWLKGDRYSFSGQMEPTLAFKINKKNIVNFMIGLEKTNYLKYVSGSDPEEDRDSLKSKALLGYNYVFKNGEGLVFVRGEYQKDNTDGKNWDSHSTGGHIGILCPLIRKLKLITSIGYTNQKFENNHTITIENDLRRKSGWPTIPGFPETPTKREDDILTISATLIFPISKRYEISINNIYINNNSNFKIYDYSRNVTMLELHLKF